MSATDRAQTSGDVRDDLDDEPLEAACARLEQCLALMEAAGRTHLPVRIATVRKLIARVRGRG